MGRFLRLFLPVFSDHFNPKPHDNAETGLYKVEASRLKAKTETKVGGCARDCVARLILGRVRENRDLRQRLLQR